MKKGVKRAIVRILVLISIILVFIWCYALSKNLVLTIIHKDEIENMQLIEYEEPIPEFDWYRVTSYSDSKIEIYFVNTLGKGNDREYKVGGKMAFYKTPNGWYHTDMVESISWSGAGSADKYIWPYWYHIFWG